MTPNLDLTDRALDGLIGTEATRRPGERRRVACLISGIYANAAEIELCAEVMREFLMYRLPMIFCDQEGRLQNVDEWRPFCAGEPTTEVCTAVSDATMAEVESRYASRIALARELGEGLTFAEFDAACKIYGVE